MGSSQRSSRIKKNNQGLKKRVFGPVEQARNERLSAKLLELANAPKEATMQEVESKESPKEVEVATGTEIAMEVDATAKKPRSKREVKRLQEARAQRQLKKSHKKPRNTRTFATKKAVQSGSTNARPHEMTGEEERREENEEDNAPDEKTQADDYAAISVSAPSSQRQVDHATADWEVHVPARTSAASRHAGLSGRSNYKAGPDERNR